MSTQPTNAPRTSDAARWDVAEWVVNRFGVAFAFLAIATGVGGFIATQTLDAEWLWAGVGVGGLFSLVWLADAQRPKDAPVD